MDNIDNEFYTGLAGFDDYLKDGRLTESGGIKIDYGNLFKFVNKKYDGDISLMTKDEKLKFIINPESRRQVA